MIKILALNCAVIAISHSILQSSIYQEKVQEAV